MGNHFLMFLDFLSTAALLDFPKELFFPLPFGRPGDLEFGFGDFDFLSDAVYFFIFSIFYLAPPFEGDVFVFLSAALAGVIFEF